MSRVPSAEKINRKTIMRPQQIQGNSFNNASQDPDTSSRIELRNSKSAYRIMSTTQQNFSLFQN